MKKKALYITLLTIVLNATIFAQEKSFILKNFTQEEGLPSNETYFVYEDSDYYLWFATDKGVVRFDGKNIQHFDLPDNVVFKIYEDKKGRIWFFSYSGRMAYFYKNKIFPYKFNEQIYRTIGGVGINDAYIDDQDNITIITKSQFDFYITNTGKVINESVIDSNYSDYFIRVSIKKIKEGYFSSYKKIFSSSKSDNVNIVFEADEKNRKFNINIPGINKVFNNVDGCKMIDDNNVLLFYKNFLIKLNINGTYTFKKMDADIVCLEIYQGNVFVGMYNHGVKVVDSSLNFLYSIRNLRNYTVSAVKTDFEGGIWFCTTEKGVFYLKSLFIEVYENSESDKLPNFRMCKFNDSVFISANTKGVFKNTKRGDAQLIWGQSFKNISDMHFDSPNRLVIGSCETLEANKKEYTNEVLAYSYLINTSLVRIGASNEVSCLNNGYLSYDGTQLILSDKFTLRTKSLMKFNYVNTNFVDKSNRIWLGNLNGLYQFDTIGNKLIPIKEDMPVFKTGVVSIKQMDNGIFAIGVKFGGVILMKDTTVIGKISVKDGLISDAVRYILPVKNRLWVATNIGLSVIEFSKMNPLSFTIHNIGKRLGFYNLIVHQLMPFQDKMLAATSQGIYAINNPEELISLPGNPLPFYINAIYYNKSDTTVASDFTVPYNSSRIKINYTAISNNSCGDIVYYYRFSNNEKKWQSTATNELLLENLAPGKYELEIFASIPMQHRNSVIRKLNFTVSAPWYSSLFFWIGVIFLSGLITFLGFKYRLDSIRKKNEKDLALNRKIADLEQTALRSQMNPHFIFNCLTSIQHLVVIGKLEEANMYLVKFARLIRKTLVLSEQSFINIREEIDYLKEYLVLEQLRLPDKFEFSFDADSQIDLEKTLIPNMMLQPIIENSIRHGIKPLIDKKGQISIKFEQRDKVICCSITDNGVGLNTTSEFAKIDLKAHKSYGIDIIKKRIEIMSESEKSAVHFEINNLVNAENNATGTETMICLPYKKESI